MKERKYITRITFRAIRGRPRVTFYRTWTYGAGDFINKSFRNPTNASLRRLANVLNGRETTTRFKTKGYEVIV